MKKLKGKGVFNVYGAGSRKEPNFKTGLIWRLVAFGVSFVAIAGILQWKLKDLNLESEAIAREAQKIRMQVDEQKSEQLEALRQLASFDTNNYLEQKARNSYNLIREGDIIIEIKTSK